MVDAASLNFEATLLAVPLKLSPPVDTDEGQYQDVADAGNAVVESFGAEGMNFISPDCHGKVNDTAVCTALA